MGDGDVVAIEKRIRGVELVEGWYTRRPVLLGALRAPPPRPGMRAYRFRGGRAFMITTAAFYVALVVVGSAKGLLTFPFALSAGLVVGGTYGRLMRNNKFFSEGELVRLLVRASDTHHDGAPTIARVGIDEPDGRREFSLRFDRITLRALKERGSLEVLALINRDKVRPRSSRGTFVIAFRDATGEPISGGAPSALPPARIVKK